VALEMRTNADKRRQEILDQAAALFNTVGYANVSVEDIATASGMRKATLYHYFKSREEIVAAMHDAVATDMLDHAITVSNSEMTPSEAIRGIIVTMMQGINERPGYLRVFFEHYREISDDVYKPIAAKRRRYADIMEDLIRRGTEQGEFRRVDPRLTALALFGMCNWTYQWYRTGAGLQPEKIADVFTDILFGGIGSDPTIVSISGFPCITPAGLAPSAATAVAAAEVVPPANSQYDQTPVTEQRRRLV
jgi:AcrR family transcriptional regulator